MFYDVRIFIQRVSALCWGGTEQSEGETYDHPQAAGKPFQEKLEEKISKRWT